MRLYSDRTIDEIVSRVTIEDVLDYFSISYNSSSKRCPCPIHGGDNPTAFDYTDGVYICRTHGCKGNVITLYKELAGVQFPQAMEGLAKIAGVSLPAYSRATGTNSRQVRAISNYKQAMMTPAKLCAAQWDVGIEAKEVERDLLIEVYKCFQRELKRNPDSDLCRFYTETLTIDADLETLDAEIQGLRWKKQEAIKRIKDDERKRGGANNG